MEKRNKALFSRVWQIWRRDIPLPVRVLLLFGLFSALVHVLARLFVPVADFVNRYVAGAVRFLLAKLSDLLPFSVAETLLIALPALLVLFFVYLAFAARSRRSALRLLSLLLAVFSVLYALFVFTIGCGYHATSLDTQLGLTRADVSADELYATASLLLEETNRLASAFPRAEGASVMPYSVAELNEKLLAAYDKLSDEYPFVQRMRTTIKSVRLSDAMSYTHITGVYSYMTGEANLNVAFPDYTLPFTAAHELAHQRGIAREDEANFMAFLVCLASDDPYVRYSGYFNMLEYVASALYRADPVRYTQLAAGYAVDVRQEMNAYSVFYEKYRDSVVGEISGAVNNTYLQWQGTVGTRSYGMVVDLAVAYYKQES